MRWRGLAVGLLLSGVGVVTPGAVGSAASCTQPYRTWWQGNDAFPYHQTPPALGTALAIVVRSPDTDGDGAPDEIPYHLDLSELTITRGDGTVTLRPGPGHAHIFLSQSGAEVGDLDGDGRDELLIGVDATGTPFKQAVQYLLPGTTSPGTHDIADVGISMASLPALGQRSVGDQDGDHHSDVALRAASGWGVYSGVDLLAPGPGGTIGTLTPMASYAGTDLGAVALAADQAPTIITSVPTGGAEVAVTVHTSPAVELAATDVPSLGFDGQEGPLDLGAWRLHGQLLVSATGNNVTGGGTTAIWNLTSPCSTYAAAPTTTTTTTPVTLPSSTPTTTPVATAPVATPVVATPTVTG